jgi:hypothetical protein
VDLTHVDRVTLKRVNEDNHLAMAEQSQKRE